MLMSNQKKIHFVFGNSHGKTMFVPKFQTMVKKMLVAF